MYKPLPWRKHFPPGNPVSTAFDEIVTAIQYKKNKAERGQVWMTVEFSTFWIDPISHSLLGHRTEYSTENLLDIVQEAARLGIILFFCEIRRKCGVLAVRSTLYVRKLKDFLVTMGCGIDWSPSYAMLLWSLFFGVLESWREGLREDLREEHEWLLKSVAWVANEMELETWDAVVVSVRKFLWIEPIHDDELDQFRDVFQAKLREVREGKEAHEQAQHQRQ